MGVIIIIMEGIVLHEKSVTYKEGKIQDCPSSKKNGTMAKAILAAHNTASGDILNIKFDAITSHDITYVGIIQTARASGLKKFPIPYVLTNCHNSLCAVGGTINEDDHVFGLSACKKFGGIFVPPHLAVIHQYAREKLAKAGGMILGSDSHTRYGALGCLAIGEGGGELAKQLLGRTYDVKIPEVVAIYLTGSLQKGVGPQDVALAIIKEVFATGFVKNRVMEFIGPGVNSLSVEERIGIDVMTTETACLSSIWVTDNKVREYYATHGRENDYKELKPAECATYDRAIEVDLNKITPMIALPNHPSNAFTIKELNDNLLDILNDVDKKTNLHLSNKIKDITINLKDGATKTIKGLQVDQGIIAGCAGGSFENIMVARAILKGFDCGNNYFSLSVYPASMPIYKALVDNGAFSDLVAAGAVIKTAFCGPCFGAGDTPSNDALSIRHTTRNFPNREGSKPQNGQIAGVALMDSKSIAATSHNKGVLTAATDIDYEYTGEKYFFDASIYDKRVFNGYNNPCESAPLIFGPNIKDWPAQPCLANNLLLKVTSVINDEVTTTDELIPSGETSSYRSNPLALAEFTLSRRDPKYVTRAKNVRDKISTIKEEIKKIQPVLQPYGCDSDILYQLSDLNDEVNNKTSCQNNMTTEIASTIYAKKPGDGSAREQAASCQRVLGAAANIARDYATKRYRSNLINWGMIPFIYDGESPKLGDWIFIPGIRKIIESGDTQKITAYEIDPITLEKCEITLKVDSLTSDERKIICAGCLINYYKG